MSRFETAPFSSQDDLSPEIERRLQVEDRAPLAYRGFTDSLGMRRQKICKLFVGFA